MALAPLNALVPQSTNVSYSYISALEVSQRFDYPACNMASVSTWVLITDLDFVLLTTLLISEINLRCLVERA